MFLQKKIDAKDENFLELKVLFREADEDLVQIGRRIKEGIEGRLVYSHAEHPPILCRVKEYRSFSNEILLRRLLDQNNILLDEAKGKLLNVI